MPAGACQRITFLLQEGQAPAKKGQADPLRAAPAETAEGRGG